LRFHDPGQLRESLEGVSVLYNTYWVRFNHKGFTFAAAVQNTRTLFQAAAEAGVQRVVHVSITNPSEDSNLEYFRGKATLERLLNQSGISYGILRPALLFGKEDILINNIAWLLRRFPVFGVFGRGDYRLQPVYVDDLAKLAVEQGQTRENAIIDAIGPQTFTYRALVEEIGRIIGKPRPMVSVPPWLAHLAAVAVGKLLGDVVITRDEIEGLMAGLLCVDSSPAGTTRLTDWASEHAEALGRRYAGELRRRKDRLTEYGAA
jgi:NADH dehydrogenase